jgi:hypothetical protein
MRVEEGPQSTDGEDLANNRLIVPLVNRNFFACSESERVWSIQI